METYANTVLRASTGLPEWAAPELFASPAQPEGTPFIFQSDPLDGDPVRIVDGAIVVGGAFTRYGEQCLTDADCACDPTDGPAWCTSDSMVCEPELNWCQ